MLRSSTRHAKSGFTLLELLLTVAALGVLAGISLPVTQSFQVRNDLDTTVATLAQNLRRAQVLARSSSGDTSWGVMMQSGSITLFRGASYAGRETAWDEAFTVPTDVTFSGATEVLFTRVSGLPTTTPTITLTSTTNETRTLTLNAQGTILY